MSLSARLFARVSGRARVIHQPFIPPEVDPDGYSRKLRLHLFVSPLYDCFLSIHATLSHGRVPGGVPEGVIGDDGSFIISFSRGTGDFRRAGSECEREAERASGEIGAAFRDGLSRPFEIGPSE